MKKKRTKITKCQILTIEIKKQNKSAPKRLFKKDTRKNIKCKTWHMVLHLENKIKYS